MTDSDFNPRLRRRNQRVKDEDLKRLSGLSHLTDLELIDTGIEDGGVLSLKDLPKLKKIARTGRSHRFQTSVGTVSNLTEGDCLRWRGRYIGAGLAPRQTTATTPGRDRAVKLATRG
jgi:hypothetical protein